MQSFSRRNRVIASKGVYLVRHSALCLEPTVTTSLVAPTSAFGSQMPANVPDRFS